MTREQVEAAALALPAATKVVQWGGSDVYKVGGKVFAVCGHEDVSFKVSEIGFMVLTENGPAHQAPHFAKGQWAEVGLDAVEAAEITEWIANSHALVTAKLTRATRRELGLSA